MGNSGGSTRYRRMGGAGGDSCIGNRKVRTITISLILIAFYAMAMAYLYDGKDSYDKGNVFGLCSDCEDAVTAYSIIIIGAWAIIVSSVLAIVLFFVNCDDTLGRVTGAGLIIGGLMYMIGYLWFISLYNDLHKDVTRLSDDTKTRYNAMLTSWFGEALLPTATAILLGCDVFMQFFDNESQRLFSNLGNLLVVSGLTAPVYYMLSKDENTDFLSHLANYVVGSYPMNSDGYAWIATGYMVVFGGCVAYIVAGCCDCNSTKCFRLLVTIALMTGGILTSIGYYIYAGEFTSHNSDSPTNETLYYIGYTVCIGGSCLVWALDIGLDDMRR